MNERIRELAHKAEFINKRHNGDEWRWGYIDPELSAKLEKFAELIVRECMEQLNISNVPTSISAGLNLGRVAIKEHFGVEE
jgi:hypothetical protein